MELGQDGSRVLFLHGLFGQGRNWTTIGKALADRHRVLLADLPHHGRSPAPDHFDYLDLAEYVADLLIATGGADDPACVVGHSMGGKVAMLVALRHPEMVGRLVVADMAPVAYGAARDFVSFAAAMQGLDLTALERRQDADRLLETAVPDPTIRGFLLQNLRHQGDRWYWQLNLDVLARDLDRLSGWPEEQLAGTAPYDGPVLWLAGERSNYVTDEYAEAMRRWFPHYRKVTIKDAGHWLHSEQPDVFLAVLRQFLGD